MVIHCKYDELRDVSALKAHPKNRNKHPEDQIDRLAKILKYQGLRAPIVVSKRSGKIVKGHGTLQAIKKNGWKEAPVVVQDFEDDDQEWLFVQSDNAIAMWAELDLKGINADLSELGPFDIDLIGIKDFEVEPLDKLLRDDDAVPNVKPTDIKLGDLFVLGDHRLLCGDSTDTAQVERLMNGEKADMVFTDPPYGINLDTDYTSMCDKAQNHMKVANDDKPFDAYVLTNYFQHAKEQFWFGANYYIESFKRKYGEGSWFVWDKYPTDKNDKRFGSLFEMVWSKQKHKQIIVRIGSLNVGHFKAEDIVHPTQKPSKLIQWFLENYSKTNAIVVDVFGGSGSTLIACEKTNRKCFMMELDPQYCQVIIDRWEQYTGKKAVKHGSTEKAN